jgi:hypothetical protein
MKTGNGFVQLALLLEHQAKIQVRLSKTRNFLDDGGKPIAGLLQMPFPHGRSRLPESLVDVRAALRRCKARRPRKNANPHYAPRD